MTAATVQLSPNLLALRDRAVHTLLELMNDDADPADRRHAATAALRYIAQAARLPGLSPDLPGTPSGNPPPASSAHPCSAQAVSKCAPSLHAAPSPTAADSDTAPEAESETMKTVASMDSLLRAVSRRLRHPAPARELTARAGAVQSPAAPPVPGPAP